MKEVCSSLTSGIMHPWNLKIICVSYKDVFFVRMLLIHFVLAIRNLHHSDFKLPGLYHSGFEMQCCLENSGVHYFFSKGLMYQHHYACAACLWSFWTAIPKVGVPLFRERRYRFEGYIWARHKVIIYQYWLWKCCWNWLFCMWLFVDLEMMGHGGFFSHWGWLC